MLRKDYYGILGVARDADENEIKTAYRRLALRNHPDTNRNDPRAEDRFKEINEAYEVLSDSGKRNRYDSGRDPLSGPPVPPSPYAPWSDPFEEGCFPGSRCRGGGFGRVFGRRRRGFQGTGARLAHIGADRLDLPIQDLSLTPDEALKGTERDIRIHLGQDTLVFTVSIPAGVRHGNLLSFKHPVGDGQETDLLFRVKIAA